MQRSIVAVALGIGLAGCSAVSSGAAGLSSPPGDAAAAPDGRSSADAGAMTDTGGGIGEAGTTDSMADSGTGDAPPVRPDAGATQDYETRCAQPGVIVCQGFDDASVFAPAAYPASGLYPGDTTVNGTAYLGTFDTAQAASGAGSLMFTIPSMTGSNPSGYWHQLFAPSLSDGPSSAKVFGQNSTFYVQFRQRFSPEFLSNQWPQLGGGTTNWKQEIISSDQSTCGNIELTTVNAYNRGFPEMYSQCGQDGFATTLNDGDYLLEQGGSGSGGYNCHYQDPTPDTCFMYPSNTWVAFYYEVQIGTWGQPDSTIQAWVAAGGQSYQQWINMPNHALYEDQGLPDYDTVTLLPYMTSRDPNQSAGPTAYTWYDELIVSTSPIAAPNN
jgi:hypothetical protein